jgi:hypothetical protein
MTAITQERLRELLDYDPETGIFRWRVASSPYARHHTYAVGDVAGHSQSRGYLAMWLDGRKYLAHRLAWLYVHGVMPDDDMDHVNRTRTDNRIENLRPASRVQNNGNAALPKHNTSGVKGVRWHKQRGKWVAQISIGNRCRYLGIFGSKDDAADAYRKAAQEHFGEFAKV